MPARPAAWLERVMLGWRHDENAPVHGKHRGRLFDCAEGETFPSGTKWLQMLVRASRGGSSLAALPGEAGMAIAQWHGRGGFSGRTKEFFAKVRIRLLRFDLKPLPGRLVTAPYELT